MLAKTFAGVTSACRLVLIGMILLGLVSGAAFATAITKVDVTNKSDSVIIKVTGDNVLKMTPLASTKGTYLGFQFACKMTAPGRLVGVHSGRVYNVRYSNYQANPPSTRIVVNTSGHLKYSTEWARDKKSVDITVWKHGAKLAAAAAVKPVAPMPVPVPAAVKQEIREETKAAVVPAPAAATVARTPQGSDPGDSAQPQLKTEAKPVMMARIAPTIAEQPRVELEKRVSLNFLGADINDVLKALSVQSGYNIVSSKDVSGNVTVSLADVTVDEAMDYVAKLSGYSYTREKNTYLVGGKDSLSSLSSTGPTKRGVAVVALNYAKSDDVMAMLKAQYPELAITKSGGSEDEKSSGKSVNQMIVLNGPEDKLEQVKQLVNEIDDSVKGLLGEDTTQIYTIKHVRAQELLTALVSLVPDAMIALAPSDGFHLNAPAAVQAGTGASASGSTVEHSTETIKDDEVGNVQALIISGPGNAVKRAVDLARQLDVRSPQVKIEAKITSLTESGGKKLGLSWDWSKGVWEESVELISLPPEDNEGNPIEGFEPLVKPTLDFFRSPLTFGATLEALVTEGEGELLAAPTLLCVEGKPGLFFVGDEIRYVIRVETTPTGQNVLTEQANVGVQLRVNADVSPDGYITMNLHPEVSMLKLAYDTDAKINLPIISRRFTDHVVRVKNGSTIAIGGLIREDETHDLSKIPILGDLPFIGKLFRHKSTSTNKTEVVMFLTASIVED